MSTGCSGSDNDAEKIKKMCETSTRLPGKLVIGDVLGPFKKIYSSSSGRKLVGELKYYDCLVERIIKEHEEKAKEGFERGDRKDLTDILLEMFKDPAAEIRLSKNDIKSFLLDIFFAVTTQHQWPWKGQWPRQVLLLMSTLS
ncbi:hypothetical protein NC651_025617 [Populus alba x Populus x berolinensis]|nr:hypothetical protein NC651_025617 [Populus alba x Populus x berolinensis]